MPQRVYGARVRLARRGRARLPPSRPRRSSPAPMHGPAGTRLPVRARAAATELSKSAGHPYWPVRRVTGSGRSGPSRGRGAGRSLHGRGFGREGGQPTGAYWDASTRPRGQGNGGLPPLGGVPGPRSPPPYKRVCPCKSCVRKTRKSTGNRHVSFIPRLRSSEKLVLVIPGRLAPPLPRSFPFGIQAATPPAPPSIQRQAPRQSCVRKTRNGAGNRHPSVCARLTARKKERYVRENRSEVGAAGASPSRRLQTSGRAVRTGEPFRGRLGRSLALPFEGSATGTE